MQELVILPHTMLAGGMFRLEAMPNFEDKMSSITSIEILESSGA
jgi:hypothetical protein